MLSWPRKFINQRLHSPSTTWKKSPPTEYSNSTWNREGLALVNSWSPLWTWSWCIPDQYRGGGWKMEETFVVWSQGISMELRYWGLPGHTHTHTHKRGCKKPRVSKHRLCSRLSGMLYACCIYNLWLKGKEKKNTKTPECCCKSLISLKAWRVGLLMK